MLRHTGQNRSYAHNLRLAVLLCLNAGFINAAGYLAFSVLTTNITGHAALLAINIASQQFHATPMIALWLLLFLAGAFLSSFYISKVGRNKSFAYTVPIVVIILIILSVAIYAIASCVRWDANLKCMARKKKATGRVSLNNFIRQGMHLVFNSGGNKSCSWLFRFTI